MLRGWNGPWCPNCVWDEVVLVSGAGAAGVTRDHLSVADADFPAESRPGSLSNVLVAHEATAARSPRSVATSHRRGARPRRSFVSTLDSAARRREMATLVLTVAHSRQRSTGRRRAALAEGNEVPEEA
jgi:hypothetical protein